MNPSAPKSKAVSGFTFIELVIVIAVVGIMSALAIGAFSNGAEDAREIVARQQQASIQTAVNGWVTGEISKSNTISEIRSVYNTASTSEARLNLVRNYLDDETYDHFFQQDQIQPSDEVTSEATRRLGWHISLGTWVDNSYPKVDLVKSLP